MIFIPDDGGRADAGFKGTTGDCVCRAIAIAACLPYQKVYDDLAELGKKERKSKRRRYKSHPRTGVYRVTYQKYLETLGFRWVPTMRVGQGCRVHLRRSELPNGRLVVRLSKHLTAVVDGAIRDTHNPSRDGERCVYGYFIKEPKRPEQRSIL